MAFIYMLHKWYKAMGTHGALLRIFMLDLTKLLTGFANILLENLRGVGIHPIRVNWKANFLMAENRE